MGRCRKDVMGRRRHWPELTQKLTCPAGGRWEGVESRSGVRSTAESSQAATATLVRPRCLLPFHLFQGPFLVGRVGGQVCKTARSAESLMDFGL